MNPEEKKLQHLLDDVVPPTAEGAAWGPERSTIIAMVGRERARRKRMRIRMAAWCGSAVALAALLFTWQSDPPQEKSIADAAPAPPSAPAITIHQVDDKELLVLLKDAPVALMEWPDGRRTLLVVER
ncbi:MAG TPA: hypothetical protein VLE43_05210 [Candidatus Saccharimonadia bacterium]|nr:hypothetical protein [Candidatus Saccharimonadia bacterium]